MNKKCRNTNVNGAATIEKQDQRLIKRYYVNKNPTHKKRSKLALLIINKGTRNCYLEKSGVSKKDLL